MENKTRKIEQGMQVNKVNLRLDNSELDMLERAFLTDTPMAKHIREQINKARYR